MSTILKQYKVVKKFPEMSVWSSSALVKSCAE